MSTLRFSSYLGPNLLSVYRAIAGFAAGRLQRDYTITEELDFAPLEAGEIDVALICGYPYATRLAAAVVPLAAPVPAGERYRGRPIYYSDVLVRRDHPAQRFEDLRGCRWGYNARHSQSGYRVVRYHLANAALGAQLDEYFGELVRVGSHLRAIDLLLAGELDSAAIDSHLLDVELRSRPWLSDQLRTVATLGPSPIQPIVARRSLEPTVRDQLRDALTSIDLTTLPALADGEIVRLVSVTDGDYDEIRRMAAVAAANARDRAE